MVKALLIIIFALLIGTLPFIDNFANIGGFVFGVPLAIVFLPYITFGFAFIAWWCAKLTRGIHSKWDAARKRALLYFCIPLLTFMYILAFIAFYKAQSPNLCTWCHWLDCVPYAPSIQCNSNNQAF